MASPRWQCFLIVTMWKSYFPWLENPFCNKHWRNCCFIKIFFSFRLWVFNKKHLQSCVCSGTKLMLSVMARLFCLLIKLVPIEVSRCVVRVPNVRNIVLNLNCGAGGERGGSVGRVGARQQSFLSIWLPSFTIWSVQEQTRGERQMSAG